MPKSDIDKKVFFSLFDGTSDRESLEAVFPYAKAEWDGEDDDSLKVEFNDTNRPDLWDAMGFARLLNAAVNGKRSRYGFFSTADKPADSGGRTFVVEKSRPAERPYSAGFCVSGKGLDDRTLRLFIGIQEKLHSNYGRKRKSMSMGLYRSDMISFPVIYRGADPDSEEFVPLHCDRKMRLREVLSETEKGREFGNLIEGLPKFPFLVDSKGKALSMPPIINSADTGALKVGDRDIFVEINGVYLKQVLLVANILACDFADLGFRILPVRMVYPEKTPFGKSFTVPFRFQESMKVSLGSVRKFLGRKFTAAECVDCLAKMDVDAEETPSGIRVFEPPYRNDFLSRQDIIEDIAIGFGLGNIGEEGLSDFSIGRLSDTELNSRKVAKIMAGLGFDEMIFNYLSGEREYAGNMLSDGSDALYIENPMSQNFRVVRPSVIPSLLKAEGASQSALYPHRTFEIGKVARKTPGIGDGTTTYDSFGFAESSADANFNTAVSVLNTLMHYLSAEYSLKATDDARFVRGRAARVMVEGKDAGTIGEINPEVLGNWGIEMPVFAAELDMAVLFSAK